MGGSAAREYLILERSGLFGTFRIAGDTRAPHFLGGAISLTGPPPGQARRRGPSALSRARPRAPSDPNFVPAPRSRVCWAIGARVAARVEAQRAPPNSASAGAPASVTEQPPVGDFCLATSLCQFCYSRSAFGAHLARGSGARRRRRLGIDGFPDSSITWAVLLCRPFVTKVIGTFSPSKVSRRCSQTATPSAKAQNGFWRLFRPRLRLDAFPALCTNQSLSPLCKCRACHGTDAKP